MCIKSKLTNWDNIMLPKIKMLEKKEKVYLIILVISMIILIFTALYFNNNCYDYDETYSNKNNKPIIVYKIS